VMSFYDLIVLSKHPEREAFEQKPL
jgi:hypothetical protein